MTDLLKRMKRGSKLCYYTGFFHVILCILTLIFYNFDDRIIAGVSNWQKPFKFTVSGSLYIFTVAWLMDHFKRQTWTEHLVAKIITVTMILDTSCIWFQSARGVNPHFQQTVLFDQFIYIFMGLAVNINTAAVFWLLILLFKRETDFSTIRLWGARIGVFTFVLGSLVGELLVMNKGHTVGLPDGGPGLPILNWSTLGGDLRVAHVFGLHGIQIFPYLGWITERYKLSHIWMYSAFAAWMAMFLHVLFQALSGQPFITLS